jgi:hypothetical protein
VTDISMFLIGMMVIVALRFCVLQRDWPTVVALLLGMVHQTWLLLR